jgi:hypothetical protein
MQQHSSSHSSLACQVPGHSFWVACWRQLAAVQGGTVCTASSLAGTCLQDTLRVLTMLQHLQEMQQHLQEMAMAVMILLQLLLPGMLLQLLALMYVLLTGSRGSLNVLQHQQQQELADHLSAAVLQPCVHRCSVSQCRVYAVCCLSLGKALLETTASGGMACQCALWQAVQLKQQQQQQGLAAITKQMMQKTMQQMVLLVVYQGWRVCWFPPLGVVHGCGSSAAEITSPNGISHLMMHLAVGKNALFCLRVLGFQAWVCVWCFVTGCGQQCSRDYFTKWEQLPNNAPGRR